MTLFYYPFSLKPIFWDVFIISSACSAYIKLFIFILVGLYYLGTIICSIIFLLYSPPYVSWEFCWGFIPIVLSFFSSVDFQSPLLIFTNLLKLWQIAIGTDDVYKTAEAIKLVGGKITREPGPLPGINTKITACLDPDGWKSVWFMILSIIFCFALLNKMMIYAHILIA